MILIYQIKSLSLSFIYGIFFAFTFNKSKKILFGSKKIINIILNILFTIDHVLIFFILTRFIDNSRLHIYMFPMFIIGSVFYKYYFTFSNKNKLTTNNK